MIQSTQTTQTTKFNLSFEEFMLYKNIYVNIPPYMKNINVNYKNDIINILRHINIDNIDDIANKISLITIQNEKDLLDLVNIVFTKAISHKSYVYIYSKLCDKLQYINIGMNISFRRCLLHKCQFLFNYCINIDHKQHLGSENIFFNDDKIIFFMIFIANLYNDNVISVNIINFCIEQLFHNITKSKKLTLRCIYVLIDTINNTNKEIIFDNYITKLESALNNNFFNATQKHIIFDIIDIIDNFNILHQQ
jgi:hypothetical protein